MATYHPPKIITTQASPAITADLAYEAHGKCGRTRILTSTNIGGSVESMVFNARAEKNGNAYKMVVLRLGDKAPNKECPCDYGGVFEKIVCSNISDTDLQALINLPITQPFELYGDFEFVALSPSLPGFVVALYMDCTQS
jgi:hypothetical protein